MKKSAVAFSAGFFLLLAAIAVFGFVWTCCRVYVPAGRMAIVTAKTGRPLPAGRILAEPGEKGVQRIPLAEGRHFLNPINNEWRIVPVVTIPAGKVGVVTSKTGKELAAGEIFGLPIRQSKGAGGPTSAPKPSEQTVQRSNGSTVQRSNGSTEQGGAQ